MQLLSQGRGVVTPQHAGHAGCTILNTAGRGCSKGRWLAETKCVATPRPYGANAQVQFAATARLGQHEAQICVQQRTRTVVSLRQNMLLWLICT
jgi:hypothetical protein